MAFAFQIYGDFSGYTDIARGISKMMGIDLMLNFRMPFFSTNPQEFWQRWHISLSEWIRDYLYFPMAMFVIRKNSRSMYHNLPFIITMLLAGLWHGAAWSFVAWGAFHGILLVSHRLASPLLSRLQPSSPVAQKAWWMLRLAGFFMITCFGLMIFRIEQLADIPLLFHNLCDPFEWNGRMGLLTMAFLLPPLLFVDIAQERSGNLLVVKTWAWPARLAIYGIFFAYIVMTGWVERIEFIYFQF